MEFFDGVYKAFVEHPTAALLVLVLLALAWVVKDSRAREREDAARERELRDAHAKAMQEANVAHLQTALQVAPLASKLVTCVEVLERLSNAALRGGSQ